ncbi:MAG: hypothetical protein KAT77_02790 [Nanoarchaeota archaeon]|nr:hypothetical protein [Nanoarchaeota archaeon]
MEKVVFKGLTDLILEEGSKDVDAIVAEAVSRYGFNGPKTRVEVLVAIALAEDNITESPDDIFTKKSKGSVYTEELLRYLEDSNGVLDDPGMQKFYDDFKARFAPDSEEQ